MLESDWLEHVTSEMLSRKERMKMTISDMHEDWEAFKIRIGAIINSINHRFNDTEGADEWIKTNGIDAAISEFDDGNFGPAYAELKEQLAYKIVSDARGASEEMVDEWIAEHGIDAAIDLVEN